MGDPAGKKQYRGGSSHISWIAVGAGIVEEIARMVKRHDEHDNTAQNINGADALFTRWFVRVGHGRQLGWITTKIIFPFICFAYKGVQCGTILFTTHRPSN